MQKPIDFPPANNRRGAWTQITWNICAGVMPRKFLHTSFYYTLTMGNTWQKFCNSALRAGMLCAIYICVCSALQTHTTALELLSRYHNTHICVLRGAAERAAVENCSFDVCRRVQKQVSPVLFVLFVHTKCQIWWRNNMLSSITRAPLTCMPWQQQ